MNENVVGKILFYIGIVQIAAGVITGLIIGSLDPYSIMNWSLFFAWTIGGFISGMLFIGFSEIIWLLHAMNLKLSPMKSNEMFSNADDFGDRSVTWLLDETDKEKISGAYQNETIIEMIPSPMKGYCLVKLKGSQGCFVKVVDIEGFGVKEVQNAEIKHKIIKWYNDKGEQIN